MVFNVLPIREKACRGRSDLCEAHTLSDEWLNLCVLTHKDAEHFFDLYRRAPEKSIKAGEEPEQFALRVAASSEMIWTIRLCHQPQVIIGDCALHGWDSEQGEIGFGGSLIPEYWGQGVMAAAFGLVTAFARDTYQVRTIRCTTTPSNRQALRFAEKLGFVSYHTAADTVILKKILE